MDVFCFIAMAMDGKYLAMYDGKNLQRNTSLSAWKQHWLVLCNECARTMSDADLVDVPLLRYEHRVSYCHRLEDAIDARMDAKEGDP